MKLSALRLFLTLLSCCLAGGCSAVVTPPATIADPVPIYFVQYNVHSTVMFPMDGHYVDFSFGDWNYAALRHHFLTDALGALTVSFASAFERRTLDADPHTGAPILHDNPDMVIRLYANRRLVDERRRELDARFQNDLALNRRQGIVTFSNGTDVYVRDTEHYGLFNNCNHVTAATFRALDYKVQGPTIDNQFHFLPPPPAKKADE